MQTYIENATPVFSKAKIGISNTTVKWLGETSQFFDVKGCHGNQSKCQHDGIIADRLETMLACVNLTQSVMNILQFLFVNYDMFDITRHTSGMKSLP